MIASLNNDVLEVVAKYDNIIIDVDDSTAFDTSGVSTLLLL